RLTMINRASRKVPANGSPDHHGAGKAVVRPPAQGSKFVPDLHHRRPDIIEKLNLDDGLEASRRHAHGATDDTRLRKLRVEAACAAKLPLQAVGDFEDSAFTLDFRQLVLVAAVGYVFAKHHHARVPAHLIAQAQIDQVHHGSGVALKSRRAIESL